MLKLLEQNPEKKYAGILLHPTSLPGRQGIGTLGKESFRFIDFLSKSGNSIWQMLPLGPSGFGNAPYSATSVFAGNPFLIDLYSIKDKGLLPDFEISDFETGEGNVDFLKVRDIKERALYSAYREFSGSEDAFPEIKKGLEAFIHSEKEWLEDFCL